MVGYSHRGNMPKKWIASAIKHPGRIRLAAKRAHMTPYQFEVKHQHDKGSLGAAARLGLRLRKMGK